MARRRRAIARTARDGACAEPEGAWDTLGTCGYADRLGELLDGTKCVTATARWGANALPAVFPFWNYSRWRSFIDFTFPGEFPRVGFNVSYANGTWLPGCEFLGTRRIHGRGSAYDVTHGLGSKHTELSTPVEMHCNYYPETRSWGQRPFIMGSTFTCEEAITVAAATNNTADLSHHQGLADARRRPAAQLDHLRGQWIPIDVGAPRSQADEMVLRMQSRPRRRPNAPGPARRRRRALLRLLDAALRRRRRWAPSASSIVSID